jgi:hypothetical protein
VSSAAKSFDWEYMLRLLPDGRDTLAASHGIRFGTRHNAKLRNIDELLHIYFAQVACGLSLNAAAAVAEAKGLPSITGVALHLRARTLGPFLADLLSRMLKTNRAFAAPRWSGYEVVLVDGTTCVRPGGDRTTARVLYSMRLADLQLLELQVSDDSEGETFRRLSHISSGQLYVGDRVYANPPGIADAVMRGSDVLVRYNWASLPLLDARKERFDIFTKLDKVKAAPREWKVLLQYGEEAISGRVIVERLPPREAREARATLRKENPKASRRVLKAAGFRMIFSTAPPDRLSPHELLTLYVLRWQVELSIKRNKSIEDLDELPNFRDDTIASWIYAKLLLAQLARHVIDDVRDLSPSGVRVAREAA